MTNQNTQETAKAESASEQQNKTRVQDTQEFKDAVKTEVSRATSTYQRQASDARKEVRTATQEIAKLATRITDTERQVELAKIAGNDDEVKSAAEKLFDFKSELDSEKSALAEREQRVAEVDRTSTIRLLSEEYGVPQVDLEGLDTVSEMRIAALEHKLASSITPSGEVEKPEAEVEKESKPIESAESLRSKGPIPDPITHPKEFDEYAKEVITAARLAK